MTNSFSKPVVFFQFIKFRRFSRITCYINNIKTLELFLLSIESSVRCIFCCLKLKNSRSLQFPEICRLYKLHNSRKLKFPEVSHLL